MGDVYAVVHEEIGKRAAMKVLHGRLSHGLDAERVQLEGQVVNHVGHPNIVDIFDAGLVAGRPFLVMERLEGVTLAQYAAQGKIMPSRAIEILLQLCDALRAAHAAGIVHRDLKPDNVFLAATGMSTLQVKLLDWGIAKVLSASDRRTMEGCVIGTPDYMAPEQACGRPVSPATDVYALGVIAYELFTESLPFDAANSMDMLTKHLRETPFEPSELWPDIPLRLEQVLLAMLAKLPRQRPSTETVARQLELVQDELEERYQAKSERWARVPAMRARERRAARDGERNIHDGRIAIASDTTPDDTEVSLPIDASGSRVESPAPSPRGSRAIARCRTRAADARRWIETSAPRHGMHSLLIAAVVFAAGTTSMAVSRCRAPAEQPSRAEVPASERSSQAEVRASAQLLPAPLPVSTAAIVATAPPSAAEVGQAVAVVKPVTRPRRVGAPQRNGASARAVPDVAPAAASERKPRGTAPSIAIDAAPACSDPPAADACQAPSSASLVAAYVALARELSERQLQIEVSDLWARFRLIRIYDELATVERRSRAAASLASIRKEIAARVDETQRAGLIQVTQSAP